MKLSGREYEQLAQCFLQKRGCKPVAANYSCRMGELDLVMKTAKVLLFVEVRFRDHQCYGTALESVDRRKQRRIILAARHFLLHYPAYQDFPCRFDVVGMHRDSKGTLQFEWITAAFSDQPMT